MLESSMLVHRSCLDVPARTIFSSPAVFKPEALLQVTSTSPPRFGVRFNKMIEWQTDGLASRRQGY